MLPDLPPLIRCRELTSSSGLSNDGLCNLRSLHKLSVTKYSDSAHSIVYWCARANPNTAPTVDIAVTQLLLSSTMEHSVSKPRAHYFRKRSTEGHVTPHLWLKVAVDDSWRAD